MAVCWRELALVQLSRSLLKCALLVLSILFIVRLDCRNLNFDVELLLIDVLTCTIPELTSNNIIILCIGSQYMN